MANPRDAVSHLGIGYHAETYPHDNTIVYDATLAGGSAQVGLAVTLESSDVISLVGDGEEVEGKLIKVEPDGFCVVQNGGNMTLPGGTSATLTAGSHIVGDLLVSAEGYIQSAASGTATHHVVSRGVIVDATTTTAVVVRME